MKLKHIATAIILLVYTQTIFAQKKNKPAPTLEDVYFTDKDDNRVEEVMVSDEYVYLVIVTTNAKREKTTVELEEDDGDFIYKGKYITAFDKINFKIKGDIHREKFVIYNSNIKKHQKLKKKTDTKKEKL